MLQLTHLERKENKYQGLPSMGFSRRHIGMAQYYNNGARSSTRNLYLMSSETKEHGSQSLEDDERDVKIRSREAKL